MCECVCDLIAIDLLVGRFALKSSKFNYWHRIVCCCGAEFYTYSKQNKGTYTHADAEFTWTQAPLQSSSIYSELLLLLFLLVIIELAIIQATTTITVMICSSNTWKQRRLRCVHYFFPWRKLIVSVVNIYCNMVMVGFQSWANSIEIQSYRYFSKIATWAPVDTNQMPSFQCFVRLERLGRLEQNALFQCYFSILNIFSVRSVLIVFGVRSVLIVFGVRSVLSTLGACLLYKVNIAYTRRACVWFCAWKHAK